MLNPSKVIREITLEVNFTPAHLEAVQASPTIVYPMLKAQNKVFQPLKLNILLRDYAQKHQSPLGMEPTYLEVDNLANKLLNLKINYISLELKLQKLQ